MNRALVLGFVVLTAACGNKTFDSLCAKEIPPPIACSKACDPQPGALNDCDPGLHCSADGKCDLQCRQGGTECGSGYFCDPEGFCTKGTDPGGEGEIIPDADCPAIDFRPTPKIPSIQLLVDRSSSMTQDFNGNYPNAPAFTLPQKYPELRNSLIGPQGIVNQIAGTVFLGATLYTTREMFTGNDCLQLQSTPNGRVLNNAAAITTLLNANPPRDVTVNAGFTPTPEAINATIDQFIAHPPPADSPPVIVLVTDGLPNQCTSTNGTTVASEAAAARAFTNGIKLYILAIALEGDGASDHIQRMANAGQGVRPGQPNARPFFGNNAGQLAQALQDVVRGAISCELRINREVDVAQAENGIVTINDERLTYGTEWVLNADGMTITILGNRCEQLKTTANPNVKATFACGAVIL